ncbi:hypothetical protein B0H14DRAFT_2887472 [Mycena olivaceomarginata]|nr:hypothetical protein B0H14DRAFT_2887472 [Mycena olivaceomarginata]
MFSQVFNRGRVLSTPESLLEPHYVPPGHINFKKAGLHQYDGCYAVVLDSLFSETELSAFLAEAEASSPWEVAQVNAGTYAYTDTSYRNSERIIYDSFELSEKIFEKIRPHLKDIEEMEQTTYINNQKAVQNGAWFLRYPKGGFFRGQSRPLYCYLCIPNLSSQHSNLNSETKQRTFYTLQFYLPSDASGSKESFVPAQGGSTRFLTRASGTKYADVEAVPRRVLVFQHADLFHTGEEVIDGVKCTVRSDILYERVGPPVLSEKHEF